MGSCARVRTVTNANSQTTVGTELGEGRPVAALARDGMAALVEEKSHPPPVWRVDTHARDVAEVAAQTREISRRCEIALDVVRHSRQDGLPFSFLTFDGEYWHLPWLPRELDSAGETFLVEIHAERAVYLDDPKRVAPEDPSTPLRVVLRMRNKVIPTSVAAWAAYQPKTEWHRLMIAHTGSPSYKVRADYLTRRVWVADSESGSLDHWHLLVRRDIHERPKFCLSNAWPDTALRDLAEMQARAMSSRTLSKTQKARAAWHW
jgi:hypothetical protein